jgi:hypothetical protein
VLGVLAIVTLTVAPASGQTLAPPKAVVGPTPDLVSLNGFSIARDGSGGLVYLQNVGGVPHAFASSLVGGVFLPGVQLDTGLPAASSQAVVAAGNGGVLLVAFINGGVLYVTRTTTGGGAWSVPQAIATGAQNPALSMSNFGKAYLAYAVSADGGSDVDVAFYSAGRWTPASAPVNVNRGDDAGLGLGRPSVVAAGDGVGIVAWGEGGHVYARRVWGISPSVVDEQLDPPAVSGDPELKADSPVVGAGGDSSYPDIVFRESVGSPASSQDRVLLTRLIAERTQTPVAIDGLSASSTASASQPALAMNEYGRGWATATISSGNQIVATQLTTNGAVGPQTPLGPAANSSPPYAAPGLAGLTSTLVAWQQGGLLTGGQIAVRYAQNGSTLGPTWIASSADAGATNAQLGLFDGGDVNGDAAVAWVQGSGATNAIEAAQIYVPPGPAKPSAPLVYARQAQPTLAWSPAREAWGPVTYTVTLDGTPIIQTGSTSAPIPAPLVDGPHTYRVTATNPAGLQSVGPLATVFVDTAAPQIRLRLSGRARARRRLTLHLGVLDAPPAEAGARASGIAMIRLSWGDRSRAVSASTLRTLRHTYARRGLYRLRITATDRAGNTTTIARYVRILP